MRILGGETMFPQCKCLPIKKIPLSGAALLTVLLFCTGIRAQVDQGAITGVVQDPSSAVIPNAHVTLTNTDTGLTFQGQSNASGVYVFSPVKIGNYTLTASA